MIHNRIPVLRAIHGLSRQELAEKLEINYQTVGFIERGDYTPSLELAFNIANLFNVRLEDVFSEKPFEPMLGEIKSSGKDDK